MPGNEARRFTKIPYEDPQDDEIIKRAYIPPEEQTINSILRNLIRNVELIAILPDVLQLNIDSDVVDSELSKALQEHRVLQQRLESDGKNDDSQLEKNTKRSFRNLLRLLKDRPLLFFLWKKELGKEIGKCERALIKELNIVGGLEAKPSLVAVKPVSSDMRDCSLVQNLPATIEEVTAKISEKSKEIKTLQSALQKKTEEKNTLEEQLKIAIKESETMEKKLQQEVNQMSTKLHASMYNNFEEGAALRRKINCVDRITEKINEDFDEEMEILQDSLELNTMKYEQEVEEVKKLEMLYKELDLEYRHILKKRQLIEEKKEREAKDLVLKEEAALRIQAWWRSYCVRNILKEREKKGKGKKGKKEKVLKEREKIGKGQKDATGKGKAKGKNTV